MFTLFVQSGDFSASTIQFRSPAVKRTIRIDFGGRPGRCGTCSLTSPATGENIFGVLAGMAARGEALAGRPTSSAEGPTRFNGFRLSAAELIRRTVTLAGVAVRAGTAAQLEKLTGRPTSSAEGPTRFNGFRLSDAELIRRAGACGRGWRRGGRDWRGMG